MTIIYKDALHPEAKIVVDLDGPDGNAFFLLGLARKLCRDIGTDPVPIVADMTSQDYEHLVQVFDACFGEYVDIHRSAPPT